ncbi:MAG: glycoside hydrolase family 25 protein [Oscillospiraceae bacterium]|nr:glycoside hydrolase family 25 protein [Oscillospiraceae bacterium]
MGKTATKSKRTALRLGILPPVLLALAVAVLVGKALRESGRVPEDVPQRNAVWVSDGVNLIEIVPDENLSVNERPAEDFTADGDLIRYRGGARQGVDVSAHQEEIDWTQAAESGISFAIVRLGYRGATEGTLYTDRFFEENYRGAREAGLDVGVYFFSQALTEQEAIQEADYVREVLAGRELQLPVMFDWEIVEKEGSRSVGREAEVVTDCAAAFCRRIAQSGYRAGVYFNRQQGYHSYDLPALRDYTFWVADPNDHPDFYYDFAIWQYTFRGSVPGIGAPVDRNMLFEQN